MKVINMNTARTMNSSEPMEAASPVGTVTPCLIKKKELAKRLSISTRTLDNWMAKRLIPYIQVSPRFYLYDYDEVLAAIRKHYQVEPVSRT